MKPIHILTSLLATLTTSLAATSSPSSSSSTDRYTHYLSQSPKSSLELDETTYSDITAKPRDYFVATLFTARDLRYGCTVCTAVQPEYDLLARSFNKAALAQIKQGAKKKDGQDGDGEGDGEGEVPKVIFGSLDFGNGRPVFQKMMISSAPVLVVFAPTTGPHAKGDQTPFTFGFNSPMTADQITTVLTRALSTSYKPPIVRPINYTRLVSAITIVIGLFTSFTVLSPYLMPLIRNRNLWAAISLILVLLFTSGHMFNHIRKVPYISGNGSGGISYFVPGFQAQLGMESQIVAAIYAVLAFATIVLAMKVPRIADAKVQHMSVIIWGIVIFGMYSCLLNIFRFKNAGYPFWLPPF